MSQCEYCGSELPAGARFCGVCGRVQGKGQGANGYPAVNRNNADETIGTGPSSSRRGSSRRPYQFTPLSPEPGANMQKPEPFILRAPQQQVQDQAWPPVQSSAPSPPARPDATPGRSPGRYSSGRPVARPASNRRPRRRKGCLIGCLSVVLLLVIVIGFAAVTLQKVLAFGSAISTQSPLSTQTGYMGGSDRVNLLVMGYGGSGHDGAYLTDSLVLMSLLPQSHHTTLISIPRDLWVQYPPNSGNYTKINSIYTL